jgi:putative Holliday junction resolvase
MPILKSAFDLPTGRLLALDLGHLRIGVAVSDEQGILATPLTVVKRRSRTEDFAALAELVRRERAVGVLAGLPLASQGEVGPQAQLARRYGGRLAVTLPVPLAFWDESYSSVDAAELLRQSGGRVPIDAAAAAVILTSFLEARRAHHPGSEISRP